MNTCDKCHQCLANDLGWWCCRYHVYVFPDKGQGKNCSEYIERKGPLLDWRTKGGAR